MNTSKKPYTIMAECYDYMLQHVDYDEWYNFIKSVMLKYCKNTSKIIEIGTGTGKFGAKFSKDGFSILGMDLSYSMLKIAKKRAFNKFKLLCADVRNFYLKEKFDFIFSVHDTMNYLLTLKELRKAFINIKKIMNKDSIFLFDITTEYNIHANFHQKSETFLYKKNKIIWENRYEKNKHLIFSDMEFILPKNKKYHEIHIQKIYNIDEILKTLEYCGFEIIKVCSDYTLDPVKPDTIMANFISRIK